jgi:spore coat protein CotF
VEDVPDFLQALKSVVQSVIKDENKTPLHIGEAMGCWIFIALAGETQVQTEAGINSTTDPELRKALQEAVNMFKSEKERISVFMRKEGVPLPPLSESKPISDPNSVPLGVKLTDNELANSLKKKISMSITNCSQAASQSLRTDVNLMWAVIMQEHITFLTTFKSLMRKRGWLKVPPPYDPSGLPQTEK